MPNEHFAFLANFLIVISNFGRVRLLLFMESREGDQIATDGLFDSIYISIADDAV